MVPTEPSLAGNISSLILVTAGSNYTLPEIDKRNGKLVKATIELGKGRYCMSSEELKIITSTSCAPQNYSIIITLVDEESNITTYLLTLQIVQPESSLQSTPSQVRLNQKILFLNRHKQIESNLTQDLKKCQRAA